MTIFLETSRRELTNITSLVQMGASKASNKDDTLDTFSFTIVVSNKKPFQIGACVRVFVADNVVAPWNVNINVDYTDFAIVSDSVTYLGKNSKAYEHTIQCVQYARKLCFQTIRGLELSQPKKSSQRDAVFSARYDYNSGSTLPYHYRGQNIYARPLNLVSTTANEKIQSGGVVSLECYMVSYNGSIYTLDMDTSPIVYDLAPALCLYKNNSGVWQYVSDILYLTDLTRGNTKHTITDEEAKTINTALSSYGSGYGVGVRFDKMSKSVDLSTTNRHFYVNLRMSCDTYRYTYRNVLEEIARKAYVKTANFDFGRLPYSVGSDSALGVPAPDFQFSQNKTVYECVTEVLKTLGCKPILTLTTGDIPTLSLQKMNDFVYQCEIGNGTIIAREENDSDGRKANRVVTSFQNGRPNAYVAEPSEAEIASDSIRYPYLFNHARNKNLGVAQKTDWWFMTDMPINEIKRCVVPLYSNSMVELYVYNNDMSSFGYQAVYTRSSLLVDITDFVYDETTYGALEQNGMAKGGAIFQAYQQNSCYYSRGSKGVYVGSVNINYLSDEQYTFINIMRSALCRMFNCDGVGMVDSSGASIGENQPWKWLMNIEYYPQAQGYVSVEGASDTDYAYEKYMSMNIANASGIIALDKLGNSIYSTANMIGESSIGFGFNVTDNVTVDQRKYGYMVEDGKMLVPTSLKQTMVGDGIYKVDGLMSKNYSKVSDRVQLDRSIRLTEISSSLALKSEIILPQYLYISCKDTLLGSDYDTYRSFGLYNNFAMQRLMAGFDKTGLVYTNACMCIKPDTQSYGVIVPLSVYSCGNTLCFEGNFDHAKSGGYQTTWEDNGIFTRPVYYTGDSGYMETFGVKLVMGALQQYDTYPKVPDYSGFGRLTILSVNYNSNMIDSGYIYAYKQPNEIMGLNLEIVALPFEKEDEPSVIPTSKFWEINPLISGKKATTFKLYGSYSPYTPFDTRLGALMCEVAVSVTYDGLKATMAMSGTLTRGTIANWKLCDNGGNALLICNQYTINGIESETLPTLYFSLFKQRI